jgi:hypothetical protein
VVGVASGRGGSNADPQNNVFYPAQLPKNRLGLYNGGWIGKLGEKPPDTERLSEFLIHAKRIITNLQSYGVPIAVIKRDTPLSNILYANESQPFEAYRQLFEAMMRYRKTMSVIGGCRMVVTPLASKLITVGTALACYEMKVESAHYRSSVAIPYAEPKRYEASVQSMLESRPVISALILTGDAYLDAQPSSPTIVSGK